ncbi:MAG: OmpA family protein [Cytophagales bacterium]
MIKNIYIVFLLFSAHVFSQNVQWASKVIEKSSQNTKTKGAAEQALGEPSVFPQGGKSPCAWKPSAKSDKEYIKVGFEKPMKVSQIIIAENAKPGCITQIMGYDASGKEYKLKKFKAEPTGRLSRLWHVKLDAPTAFDLVAVKVVLDNDKFFGEPQIDAIGIMETVETVEIKIKEAKGLVFDSKPENLGKNVNSKYSELMPLISPDGRTLYFCRDSDPNGVGGQDVWFSNFNETFKEWEPARNMGYPINTQKSDVIYSITPDGNTGLISGKRLADGTRKQGYSVSQRIVGGWGKPVGLNVIEYYNDNDYVEACLAQNGKAILTTIENDDSYGERDIYVSFPLKNGDWSKPMNLGPIVNTAADECSPFLASDNVTLYYSTPGKSGYGSNDIFITKRLDDTWTNWSEPLNLGSTINTSSWDAYYTVPASGEYAYFVSSENSLGNEDIFRIKLPPVIKPEPVVLVSGKVYNAKTKEPIAAQIIYEKLPEGKEVGVANSNPNNGEYKIVLPYGENYGFLAQAKGFIGVNQNIDLKEIKKYVEIVRDLYLVPIEVGQTVRLNNIFFDFGKATLREESFAELNRVVQFLNENPNVKIELSGHTDDVGDDNANLKLSINRAKSVLDYLVSKGINSSRLVSNGYGETMPIAPNDTDEGRQLNRRVEFRIASM